MSNPPSAIPANNPIDEISDESELGEVIQEFLRTTGFSNLEAYLEDQFRQGVNPRKATEALYWHLYSPTSRNEIDMLNNRTTGAYIFGIEKLHLSKRFIDSWLRYPSSRYLSEFNFLEGITIPRMRFMDVRYLTPLPHQVGNPGFLVDQSIDDPIINPIGDPVITPIPCVLFDNQLLYIPILRYILQDPLAYQEGLHCGTYYYFDEGPQLYLKSNKTLIAPDPAHALFYLRGGDANAAQLVLENKMRNRRRKDVYTREIFEDPMYPPGPKAFELAEKFQSHKFHCEPEDFETTNYMAKGSFEQILCRLGRHLGYDVIISTHPSNFNSLNPAGKAQMFDTRAREESFANLVYRIP